MSRLPPTLVASVFAALFGAVTIAAAQAAATAAQPASSAPPQLTLAFDERGVLEAASAQALAALPALAANATDVFILAHGWRNDAVTAECRYQLQVSGIARALLPAIRPLFVKIVWPSAVFQLPHDECGATSPNRPFFVEREQRHTTADIRSWAEAAFPAAARSRGFGGDVQKLSVLLERDSQPPLTPAQTRDIATILVRWRNTVDIAPARSPDAPDERALAGTVDDVVAQWQSMQGGAPTEAGLWTLATSLPEVFSFWTMKDRAGVVGARGVSSVLRTLATSVPAAPRLHLIGHSFGGKLLAAAVVGVPGATPNTVESLTILQGAFSHFAFSTADEIRALDVVTDADGAYADVLRRKLAAVLTVTYSTQDRENQRWYPLGARVSRDALETTAPRYASLGARGLDGPAAIRVNLREESLGGRYVPTGPLVFNVDASGVVLDHSNIMQERIFHLIADVVSVARRKRAFQEMKK